MAWHRKKCNSASIPGIASYSLIFTLSILYFSTLGYDNGFPQLPVHILLFFFVVITLMRTTLMDPGFYERAKKDEYKSDDYRVFQRVEIRGASVNTKWCTTCTFFRPVGAVHCSECDHCVEMFDHHCPWVLNCVGRRNYRYFFMFLLSLTVHILWGVCVSSFYMANNKYINARAYFIIAGMVAGVGSLLLLPVAGLAGFHTFLISTGRTTNEHLTHRYGRGVYPFTRGFVRNWLYFWWGPQFPRLKPPKPRTVCDPYSTPPFSYSKCAEPASGPQNRRVNGVSAATSSQTGGYSNKQQSLLMNPLGSPVVESVGPAGAGRVDSSVPHSLVVMPPRAAAFDTHSSISNTALLSSLSGEHPSGPMVHAGDAVLGTISLGSASLGDDALSLTTLEQLAQANHGVASPSSMHTHTASSQVTNYLLTTGIQVGGHHGHPTHPGSTSLIPNTQHQQYRATPVSMLSSEPSELGPPLYLGEHRGSNSHGQGVLGELESLGDTASRVVTGLPPVNREDGSYCNLFDAESGVISPTSGCSIPSPGISPGMSPGIQEVLMQDQPSPSASALLLAADESSSSVPLLEDTSLFSAQKAEAEISSNQSQPLSSDPHSGRSPHHSPPHLMHRPLSIHSTVSRVLPDLLGVAPRASMETLSGGGGGPGSSTGVSPPSHPSLS